MGAQQIGLTLRGPAQWLEAPELENERMRSENAELRHKVATLEGSDASRDEVAPLRSPDTERSREFSSAFGGWISRRWLLSRVTR